MSDFNLSSRPQLQDLWNHSLIEPWQELASRPKKEVRGRMVRLGALLAGGQSVDLSSIEHNLRVLSEAVETLHLGSLIIDDIEDNSKERRGGPTLHAKYGLPIALNLGNFLYFEAMTKVTATTLSDRQKLRIYEEIHTAMVDGHRGQALDLSMPIDHLDRNDVEDVCLQSLDLKSGVLMALAMKMGALAVDPDVNLQALHRFGVSFGRALQILDDCGNLQTRSQSQKHLEDLVLRRPSWIWATLAKEYSLSDWKEFSRALDHLPNVTALETFLQRTHLKERAYDAGISYLQEILTEYQNQFQLEQNSEAYVLAKELGERLSYAYQTQNSSRR